MAHRVATTPAQAMPLPPSDLYRHIMDFVAGGRQTSMFQDAVRRLRVATEDEQQRLNHTLATARYPTLASRRLLFAACEQGNRRLVKFLLSHCDIESVDEYGNTVLLRSAACGRLRLVNFLLDNGANPLTDGSYGPLLRNALAGGNARITELVLQLAGDCVDVGEILGNNQSLFSKAVAKDQVDFAAQLLAYGGSALSESDEELMWLLKSVRSVKMAKLLYDHGVNFEGDAGMEAIVEAMCRRDTSLVEFFLDHGVDVRRLQYKTTSPLHCACIYRRSDWVEMLAARCIDLDARLEDGSTALQKCFLGGEAGRQVHQLLVDLGADVNARSNSGVDSKYRGPSSWREPERTEDLWRSKELMRRPPQFGPAA